MSYVANFYDLASRMTSTANLGTNGGTSWSVGQSLPSEALVTSYEYEADEVQTLILLGSDLSGDFTLTFKEEESAPISHDASGEDVQAALEELPSIGQGNVLVDGEVSPWKITFVNELGQVDQPQLIATSNLEGTGADVQTGTAADGVNGRLAVTTDPRGIVTRTSTDALGRTTRVVEAFSNAFPTIAKDRRTEYTYDGSDHVLTMTARLPGGTFQSTEYVYDMPGGLSGSPIFSNDLLWEIKYPDTGTGEPSSTNKEAFTYNALGQRTTFTDRIKDGSGQPSPSVHTYTYDVMGRLTKDAVTTLGSGVEGSVRRLEFSFDTAGRPEKFTSYDAASGGNVVNQVQREYNGLGQLRKEYQAHNGTVNVSTSLRVEYSYSTVDSNNRSRLEWVAFPYTTTPGDKVHYLYNSGIDDDISRVSTLADDASGTTKLESYAYLGYDTIVKATRPIGASDEIGLNYLQLSGESASDSGDPYTGFDMFGRVIDQRWVRTNSSNGLVATLDRFKYGYDKNGNRLYRDNAQGGGSYNSFDELYHADGASNGYDNLNRLTDFRRGTLNGSNDTITSATRTQTWTLSALGNWDSLTQTGGGSNETRTHNKQNQLTQINSTTITYDGNGNALSDGAGRTLSYDPWNRLAASTHTNNEVRHEYDALGRRVEEVFEDFQINSIVTPTDLYYATDLSVGRPWQLIEERSGGTTTQYVWSQRYIDAPVLRDRGSERLFVQGDANFNVTALVNTSGTVVERYVYDPYGTRTAKTATWGVRTPNGVYNFKPGHQGGRLDFNTKLVHFGLRDLGPALGRWVQQDPIRYPDGMNLYQYEQTHPTSVVDPSGTAPIIPYAPPAPEVPTPPTVPTPDPEFTEAFWTGYGLEAAKVVGKRAGAVAVAFCVGYAAGTAADKASAPIGGAIYGPGGGDACTSDVIGDWLYWHFFGGKDAPGIYNPRPTNVDR